MEVFGACGLGPTRLRANVMELLDRLQHPQFAAARVGRVRGAVLGGDDRTAAFSYLRGDEEFQAAVIPEISDRHLLGAARAGIEEPLRREIVDVVDALTRLETPLSRPGSGATALAASSPRPLW